MKKRALSIWLILCIVCGTLTSVPITAYASERGTCGDNLTWTFDNNGTLTISGTGAMYDFAQDNPPWHLFEFDIKSVKINKGVTTVGGYAFYNNPELSSITLPDGLTRIGVRSFCFCDGLSNITLPDGLKTIDEEAFRFCKGLTNIKLPDGLTEIGIGAFSSCTSLTNVTIPSSVEIIDSGAFYYCTALTSISVDKNNETYCSENGNLFNKEKTVILQYAAGKTDDCYTIPSTVTDIVSCAFYSCSHLKKVTVPNSVANIGFAAFEKCQSLTNVTLSNSVKYIGVDAFYECTALTDITMSNNLKTIDDGAFYGCTALKSIIIPNGVTFIYSSTFEKCTSLTRILIPNSVTNIDYGAFRNCTALTDVYYSGNESAWNKITIDSCNNSLSYATIHFGYDTSDDEYKAPISFSNKTFNFASGNKKSADFNYSDNYFKNNSYLYNHNLARFSMRLALSTFAKKTGSGINKDYSKQYINAKNMLESCGFKEVKQNSDYEKKPTSDSIGIIAGYKKVDLNDDYTLIAVAIRGGNYEAEWGGNFNVGNSIYHDGFKKASNTVVNFIQDYIDKKGIQGKVKLLITGYSRAAATANLTAAYFDENPSCLSNSITLARNDLYAYCFETPAGVKHPDNDSGLYNNIFSIVNQHDPVPMVAMRKWGFDRYGQTLYLPAAQTNGNYFTLREKMIKLYDEYIGNNMAGISSQEKKTYKVDTFSKYTFKSTVTWQYDLYNAQGVYLEKIVDKLAYAIGNTDNYKNNYQDTFSYVGEELIGNKNYDEFLDFFLLDLTTRLAAKKLTPLADILTSYKYIVRKSLVDTFKHMGIPADNDAIDTLLNVITDLGFDDLITILKNLGNFGQAHYPELCMAWLDAIDESDFACKHLRTLYLNCPVDLEIYDSNDILVAAIYNDKPQEIDGSSIIAYVDENGQKIVYLPADEEYKTKVIATDTGEVSYSMQEYDAESDETKVINYNNMTIDKGDTLEGTAESLVTSENAEYSLTSNSVEINKAEITENAKPVKIRTSVTGNGGTNEGGDYYIGEYAQVTAVPFENEEFLGWFDGNTLVSDKSSYRFQVTEALTLTAKFTDNTCAVTLADSDDTNDIIDIIRVVKGNTLTLNYTPEKTNYTFDGLYRDSALKTAHTNEYVFSEDTTLYVKWIKNINITTAVYSDNTIKVKAAITDKLIEKPGILFIALYYDDRLIKIASVTPTADVEFTFENIIPKGNNYVVGIMYWNNTTDLVPLNACEIADVSCNT